MKLVDAAKFRVALVRYAIYRKKEHGLIWLAARLPHALTDRVLAHVAVATMKDNESPAQLGYMDTWKRWSDRELRGHAAKRHPSTHS